MKKAKNETKKIAITARRSKKKTKKRLDNLTIYCYLQGIFLGFYGIRLIKKGHKAFGFVVASFGCAWCIAPYAFPFDFDLYATIAAFTSFVIPMVSMPAVAITNLISPKTAEKLL